MIINNIKPVIISAPGNVNINKALNKLGYNFDDKSKFINNINYLINNTKNDYKIFWKELIILIIIIYILYKLIK